MGYAVLQNHNEHIMPNKQFAVLMTAVLKKGKAFRFQASGSSMSPFIKDGDILTLVGLTQRRIQLGNVLAFYHPHNGKLTVHRVVNRKQKTYLMKLDNGMSADGWVTHDQVIGIVQAIERGGNKIRFGLGWEKVWIAHLSRWNILMPTIHVLWRFLPTWLKHRIKGQ